MKKLSERFKEILRRKADMIEEGTDFDDTEIKLESITETLDEFQADIESRLTGLERKTAQEKTSDWGKRKESANRRK